MGRKSRRRSRDSYGAMATLSIFGVVAVVALGVVGYAVFRPAPPVANRPAANDGFAGPIAVPGPVKADDRPAVAALVPRPPLQTGWIDWTHPDRAFSIYLPGTPVPDVPNFSLLQPIPIGRLVYSKWSASRHDEGSIRLHCTLHVTAYSPEIVAEQKVANERPSFVYPDQRSTAKIIWRGLPATEVKSQQLQTRRLDIQREIWIGNRFYSISVEGMPTDEERTAFFESFVPGS